MKCSPPVFDMDSLHKIEALCRQRIEQEPDDTSARLRLAWCLVVQAMHEAGKEATLNRIAAAGSQTMTEASPRTARQLLHNCLRQAMMVIDLSINPDEQKEAESLRTLIRMSGGVEALETLMESTQESDQIIAEITQSLRGNLNTTEKPRSKIFFRSKDLLA